MGAHTTEMTVTSTSENVSGGDWRANAIVYTMNASGFKMKESAWNANDRKQHGMFPLRRLLKHNCAVHRGHGRAPTAALKKSGSVDVRITAPGMD